MIQTTSKNNIDKMISLVNINIICGFKESGKKTIASILEKKYKFINSEKSPSKTVGYKPSKNFKKVEHRVLMLSLSNAFSEGDLNNFEKKIFNPDDIVVLSLSGRGDKDLATYINHFEL